MKLSNDEMQHLTSFDSETRFATVAQMLKETAHRRPSGVALLAAGRVPVTYEGLVSITAAVRRLLRARGIEATDRVAISLSDGPDAAVAFLSLVCSCVVAPLNPAYRPQELEFYLRDLKARAVVVPADGGTSAAEVARRLGVEVLEWTSVTEPDASPLRSRGTDTTQGRTSGDEPDDVGPDQMALLLHTSGTTSGPKLVPLSHRNLFVSATNISRTIGLTPADRCLNVMPLFHIHGLVGALLSTIAAGSSIVLMAGFQVDAFFSALDEFGATWYTAVPTIHQLIVGRAMLRPDVLERSRLRFIRSSSAALPASLMIRLEEVFRAPVIESYGMTEASHQMASNMLPPLSRVPGSVGRPAGPEIAVLDEEWNAVPTGGIGEVAVRGPNVTAGYEGNDEANGSSFREGWFRTGDQGRFDEQGYLFLTGRIKELINRGGEKISPREIDEALLEHPAVAEAVAFGVPHESLGEHVAAAVVLRAGIAVNEVFLRQFLSERLASHKVPSQIVIVTEIPRGATGKVRRVDLYRQMEGLLKPSMVPAASTGEKTLSKLWCKLYAVHEVSVLENFFAMGGDSLAAVLLASEIADVFDITFTAAEIFRYPVLRDQARFIEDTIIEEIHGDRDGVVDIATD
jgi:oxalate---CoA ligase